MTDETRLAFDHPEARAALSASDVPLDRISLRDHVVEADIGAFAEERGQRQRLQFDIVVEVARAAGRDDDVDRILSYDRLTEAVAAELAAGRVNLLETLADGVAARILAHPLALKTFVRIQKLDRGPGALGVEIVREGRSAPPAARMQVAPSLLLIPAGRTAEVAGLLDRLVGEVLVLCPGLPRNRMQTVTAEAQRRIDLLALDQTAWDIAARDARLKVVASRTELDWSAGRGRATVWAPSKMLLDTAGEGLDPSDPAATAGWLAKTLGAARIIAPEGLAFGGDHGIALQRWPG